MRPNNQTEHAKYLRGRIAGFSRSRTPDDPEYIEARTELAVSNIAEFARVAANEAPPMTAEQVDRLTVLIRGYLGGDAA
ncbi:hypothetical protein [Mycolicibacter kumamotonensis]|uniref:Uncharacterized protein n=1 Tax=Mycolicibacter kumamotonensis TaxID=354243 RepID=A0A7K3LHK6_9MYCO|nr:hypothetical protein [Mycolicibacter kumamotonensis]NDJ91854.1 hypothetical protein [Mycolicibacter kumamotonensis]